MSVLDARMQESFPAAGCRGVPVSMNDAAAKASAAGLTPAQAAFHALRDFIGGRILGQEALVERLLIALLADGHLLVEGAPGLAKTRAVQSLGVGLDADFHRVQFTPDLLPADLTGTDVYRPQDGSFHFRQGPLFHNLVLADEINRAPAKVQSALLEAMAERQITIGRQTHALPELFLVMATQNPIEQEGTYPLPEAQLDRFLMHVRVDYPDAGCEREILRLARAEARAVPDAGEGAVEPLAREWIFRAREEALALHVAEALEEYMVQLVLATRVRGKDGLRGVQWGCSPRATIMLDRCARARAWLAGRDYVSPDDVQAVLPDVMRHRLILDYEAEAEGMVPDDVIRELLTRVAVP